MTINIALGGAGAFGIKHLNAITDALADESFGVDAEVVAVVDPNGELASDLAGKHNISWTSDSLDEVLASDNVDAVVLASPTPLHAPQALACLEAGKHVEVEIPLCDNLADGRAVLEAQQSTGLVAMCGHTRRFNPSHQWVRDRITAGEFSIQHMDVQTFFFRRTNTNALGLPRTWTDHLLWHHAAHTVDLFQYQTGDQVVDAHILEGPTHPELGIAMDMSIGLKTAGGAICTLALSFNNEGPLGTFFRYIGDTGTYIARYDDLARSDTDGNEEAVDVSNVDVSMNGIELQDREFLSAIVEGREPNSSVASVWPCYEMLDRLDKQLGN